MEFFIPVSSLDSVLQVGGSYFQVSLPKRVTLVGEYEVSLWELSYPSDLHTIVTDNESEVKISYVSTVGEPTTSTFKIPIKCYHSLRDFIDMINDHIAEFTKNISLEIDDDGKVNVFAKSYADQIVFSPLIQDILGLKANVINGKSYGCFLPNMLQQQNFLNVCVDIVQPMFFGKKQIQLIRRFQHEPSRRRYVLKTFSEPMYLPLLRNDFDTVTVQITNDYGNPISFDRGTIFMILHIRPRKKWNQKCLM